MQGHMVGGRGAAALRNHLNTQRLGEEGFQVSLSSHEWVQLICLNLTDWCGKEDFWIESWAEESQPS